MIRWRANFQNLNICVMLKFLCACLLLMMLKCCRGLVSSYINPSALKQPKCSPCQPWRNQRIMRYIHELFALSPMYPWRHIYVWVFVCEPLSIRPYIDIYIYQWINMHKHVRTHTYIWVLACGMHLCVCVRIYVYPASYMHIPRLSCWSCKFHHCYWNPFHRIPGVVMVVFMSSLAAPRVVVMIASDAVRDAWRFVSSTGDPRDPVVSLLILNLLPCTKTPDRGCECIDIYSSESFNLIFLWKKCCCMSDNVFRCDFNSIMPLLILLIFTCTLSEMKNKRCPISISTALCRSRCSPGFLYVWRIVDREKLSFSFRKLCFSPH